LCADRCGREPAVLRARTAHALRQLPGGCATNLPAHTPRPARIGGRVVRACASMRPCHPPTFPTQPPAFPMRRRYTRATALPALRAGLADREVAHGAWTPLDVRKQTVDKLHSVLPSYLASMPLPGTVQHDTRLADIIVRDTWLHAPIPSVADWCGAGHSSGFVALVEPYVWTDSAVFRRTLHTAGALGLTSASLAVGLLFLWYARVNLLPPAPYTHLPSPKQQ